LPEIRNPNLQTQGPGGSGGGGGGDLRSTMGFGLLLIVVLFGYQYFFKAKTEPPAPQNQAQIAQNAAPAAGQAASATSSSGSAQSASAQAAAPVSGAAPTIAATMETETTVENEQYRIVLTNRGAQVKHWILKKYLDTAGKPLDMVQQQAAAKFGLPLSFFTYEPALTQQLNSALYQVKVEGAQPSATGLVLAPAAITFHYQANGLDVVKTLHFDASYVIGIDAAVKRNGSPVRALVQWPSGLGDMEEFLPQSSTRSTILTPSYFAWLLNGKHDTQTANAGGFLFWSNPGVSNGATLDAPYQYAGITDLYFGAVFLPNDPAGTTVVTLHNAIDIPSDLTNPNSQKRPANVLGVAVGDTSGLTSMRLFAGPKGMDLLSSIHTMGSDGKQTGPSLEPLIQFGFWTIIAKPLYLALRFLNEHGVPNWGWDIIIVTVIFNLLMLPTRLMMMRSSLRMMRIQPKVDAIRRKYANLKATDPKRAEMNTEMMALYKEENVSMYGSCLPLLIQMPLFFAYYRVLANVIELRQAHWYWLHDLSMSDPKYILPAIIIASMFLVQFLTPSPGMDPNQRRIMAIMMPIIFGYSMAHFASGLALYWGTGNLINLGIQLAINQSSMGKEMHAIAAKRAAKKLGGNSSGSRTIQGKR
jgi:YidC/Oxa1 family membrane protein insertase